MRELAGGGEELFKVATAGEYFGEIGVLFHLPRSATVRARTDATVIGYTSQGFRERLGTAGVRGMIEHNEITGRLSRLRRHQAEHHIGAEHLESVKAPMQCARDCGYADVVDRGDRSTQQNRCHVGDDPVDQPLPSRKAPASVGPPSTSTSVRSASALITSWGSWVLITMVRESSFNTLASGEISRSPTTTRSG